MLISDLLATKSERNPNETVTTTFLAVSLWSMLSIMQKIVRKEEQNGTGGMKPGTNELTAGLTSGKRRDSTKDV